MNQEIAITFGIILGALALFIWNRVPAVIVAIGAALALYFTGILTGPEMLAGFGDPIVVLIAGLFVVAAALEASGVTLWAAQGLISKAGASRNRLMILLMLLAALFCATISVNATVATLLPLVVVVAVRMGVPTSQLLLPMCFATHGGTMLTLIGAPLNIIASNFAAEAGYGGIGFFEFAIAGVPLLLGTMVVIMLLTRYVLPHHNGPSLPADFSKHATTLVEQFRLTSDLKPLRVRETSSLVGQAPAALDLTRYPGLSLVTWEDGDSGGKLARDTVAEGDVVIVRGDAEAVGRFAADQHLAPQGSVEDEGLADSLFNRQSGLAEVVIPPRSKLIGLSAHIGMAARDGELIVLGIQRAGQDIGKAPVQLAVGDHLLLQGTWRALDKHLADPQVLVVDSPEVVRRQSVPLSLGAKESIGILALMIVLLVTGWVMGAIAAVICASLVVLLGVLKLPQALQRIDWSTCILVGATIPIATALTNTGAAVLIADTLVSWLGALGPRAVLAGIFIATLAITSVISNTAAALLMLPIAIAAGGEMEVSAMPFIIAAAIGAHAALLTPVATPVNLMLLGPGGYKFSDYAKLGAPIAAWWLVVVMFIVPLYWRF